MGPDKIEHQPREHSVPCIWCRRPTWNHNAVCDKDKCVELEKATQTRPGGPDVQEG